MSLRDYYRDLDLYRKDDSDPLTGGVFVLVDTIQGYIQKSSGREALVKNDYGEFATFRLYTATTNTIKFGDRINKGSVTYHVTEPGEPDGVVSLGKHKEIGLRRVING